MGFNLIPLAPSEKRPPRGFRWEPYQDSASTPEQLEEWAHRFPGSNWGAIWGQASGLLALDVDSPEAQRWVDEHGGTRSTSDYSPEQIAKGEWLLTVPPWYETGRGWQYVYRLPPDLLDARGVNPMRGVEIRANGQYSVVPPSTHPSGKSYRWNNRPTSFAAIPTPPEWIVRALRGEAIDLSKAARLNRPVASSQRPRSKTVAQRTSKPAKANTDRPTARPRRELAGSNPRLLTEPGFSWLLESTFLHGNRNRSFHSLALLMRAAGRSEAETSRELDRWRAGHTSPVYGAFPDKPREPTDVLAAVYRYPSGFRAAKVLELVNDKGECMPAEWAQRLERLYPKGKAHSERIHRPRFESVARILDALDRINAWNPTTLSHKKLAKVAGISPDQVAKVTGFLTEIGVRTTSRHGSSTVSVYCLQNLNLRPNQLIKHLAKWSGWKWPWLVWAKRLWRISRRWMQRALSVLGTVWNWIHGATRGERPTTNANAPSPPDLRAPPINVGAASPSGVSA